MTKLYKIFHNAVNGKTSIFWTNWLMTDQHQMMDSKDRSDILYFIHIYNNLQIMCVHLPHLPVSLTNWKPWLSCMNQNMFAILWVIIELFSFYTIFLYFITVILICFQTFIQFSFLLGITDMQIERQKKPPKERIMLNRTRAQLAPIFP